MSLHSILRGRKGQAIVDYAMIVALVGACLVAILGLVGNVTRKAFTVSSTTITRQAGAPPAGASVPAIPVGSPKESEPDGDPGEDPDSVIHVQSLR